MGDQQQQQQQQSKNSNRKKLLKETHKNGHKFKFTSQANTNTFLNYNKLFVEKNLQFSFSHSVASHSHSFYVYNNDYIIIVII